MNGFFETYDEAYNYLQRIVESYRKNKNRAIETRVTLVEKEKAPGHFKPALIIAPVENNILYFVIVHRQRIIADSLPEKKYYVSSIRMEDFWKGRHFFVPVFINFNNKITVLFPGTELDYYPIILNKDEMRVSKIVHAFNLNEMNEKNQSPDYKYLIEAVHDVKDNELCYTWTNFDQDDPEDEKKDFRFFKTKGQEYAYILLNTDGSQRNNNLKITIQHYYSDSKAKKWYGEILKVLKSDNEIPPSIKKSSIEKLTTIYKQLAPERDYAPFNSRTEKVKYHCLNSAGVELIKGIGLTRHDFEIDEYFGNWFVGLVTDLRALNLPEEEFLKCGSVLKHVQMMLQGDTELDFDIEQLPLS